MSGPLFCFWAGDASRAISPQGAPIDGTGNRCHVNQMIRLLISLHRAVLFAVVTVALVTTGFAHRVSTTQDDALAYAIENGISLSDLCGGDLGSSMFVGAECQACQITGSANLPPLTGVRIDLDLVFHAAFVATKEVQAILRAADPAHRPQGPPVA